MICYSPNQKLGRLIAKPNPIVNILALLIRLPKQALYVSLQG
jgi:hypothetical protein